jgi:hypothetical protein
LIIHLTSPTEVVSGKAQNLVDSNHLMSLRPVAFRHLFNPENGDREFVAGFQWPEGESRVDALGIQNPDESFVPYGRIALDGMRSRACRTFLRSFSDMLVSRSWEFQVAEADPNRKSHQTIFEQWNKEAGIELQFATLHGVIR